MKNIIKNLVNMLKNCKCIFSSGSTEQYQQVKLANPQLWEFQLKLVKPRAIYAHNFSVTEPERTTRFDAN